MKKAIITLILASITNISSADLLTGNHPYVGVNLDYVYATFDHVLRPRDTPGSEIAAVDHNDNFASSVGLGYQWITATNTAYSLEAVYRDINVAHTKYGRTTDTKKVLRDDLGLRLGIGEVFMNRFMVKGLFGVDYARFLFHSNPANHETPSSDFDNYYSRPGITLGMGALYKLNTDWAASLGYEYTWYAHKSNISGDDGFYERDGSTETSLIELGISYYF